jgi:ABC-type phosphate/phosphonate transport system substrate-binding protein
VGLSLVAAPVARAAGQSQAGTVASGTPAGSDPHIAFVTVAIDPETRQADGALGRYLMDRAHLKLDSMPMEYGEAIRRLASWPRGSQPYLARMTPYAYVAAEMLGASFDILGTYNSKATSGNTYHAYFVVHRKHFSQPNPGLDDLLRLLRSTPLKFIYHDKFSTSSYFLPSLYFRRERIFATSEATDPSDRIVSIHVAKDPGGSSSRLVEHVADGTADLAAVWDGTKQKFEKSPVGRDVYFIQLPDPIPNDLLVYSRWMDPGAVNRLRESIRSMTRTGGGEIHTGDYRWWDEFAEADAARQALADLRRIATERPAPVTVLIQAGATTAAATALADAIEAAQQAIRLSGTEFVLYDEDAHVHKDVVWRLAVVHDGAVTLETDIVGSEVPPQHFQISFIDQSDLTKRIGGLLHSRMHRIRYIWPYEEKSPTVIRDVDFSIPVGTTLKARRITWLNPERNAFREGELFDAPVRAVDFFKFSLDDARFPKATTGAAWGHEPMSNVAYRVVLVRPSDEPALFQALTGVFLFLLTAAAAACALDVRRQEGPVRRRETASTSRPTSTSTQTLAPSPAPSAWASRAS